MEAPSPAMWCSTRSSTCSSRRGRTGSARSGGWRRGRTASDGVGECSSSASSSDSGRRSAAARTAGRPGGGRSRPRRRPYAAPRAARQVVQGGGQRGHVEVTGQPQRDGRLYVGGRTLETVQEPQPFLRVRQRQPSRARLCRDAGAARAAPVSRDGELRHAWWPRTAPTVRSRRRARPGSGSPAGPQTGNGRRARRSRRRGTPRARPVISANRPHRISSGAVRGARPDGGAKSGTGSAAAVELAVGGERERGQLDDLGRDHVLGQRLGQRARATRRASTGRGTRTT